MSELKDLTGQTFGRLKIVKRAPDYIQPNGRRRVMWECVCNCPNKTICVVRGEDLRSGNSQSCGCYQKECAASHSTHGKTNSRLFYVWHDMKTRCYNPNVRNHKDYGGRGITVCPEWVDKESGFINFYNWAIANGYDETAPRGQCTLERIATDGNYEPGNCKWATNQEQANNKRNNHYIIYKGARHTMAEWAKIKSMSCKTLASRIYKGWPIEKALNTPVK